MKYFFTFLFCFLFFGANQNIYVQIAVTPYDELPGVNPINKPSYDGNYPVWAKMLYQYPANFNEIEGKYQQYLKENGKQKNAIIRYYKIWRAIVGNYADENGVIHLVDSKETKIIISKKTKDTSNSNWTFLGPKNTFWLNTKSSPTIKPVAPWQVNVYSFDVFKGNSNILYAGTETGYTHYK